LCYKPMKDYRRRLLQERWLNAILSNELNKATGSDEWSQSTLCSMLRSSEVWMR